MWEYSDVARDVVVAMKYNPSPALAIFFGKLLAFTLMQEVTTSQWDRIVIMPTSHRSGLKRGFNQCAVLGYALSKHLRLGGVDVISLPVSDLLVRQRKRAPHSTLDHEHRLRSLRRLFSVVRSVEGERILLLDDVVTTGATVGAASFALLQSGAISVDVVSLARASSWQRCRARVFKNLA